MKMDKNKRMSRKRRVKRWKMGVVARTISKKWKKRRVRIKEEAVKMKCSDLYSTSLIICQFTQEYTFD
jgi:hypothetical protein